MIGDQEPTTSASPMNSDIREFVVDEQTFFQKVFHKWNRLVDSTRFKIWLVLMYASAAVVAISFEILQEYNVWFFKLVTVKSVLVCLIIGLITYPIAAVFARRWPSER